MTDFNFNEWFELFWNTYPKDLLHNTKGAKEGPWRDKLKLKVKTLEDAEKILAALREQMRYRRKLKEKGEHKTKWQFPMVSVWCNQCRWSEEIPSYTEINKPPKRNIFKKQEVQKASEKTKHQNMMEIRKALYGK